MNRKEIICSKLTDNPYCVDYSLPELLVLFMKNRDDINFQSRAVTKEAINALRKWIGTPVNDGIVGIIDGVFHYPYEVTDADLRDALRLYNGVTPFQKLLYSFHKPSIKNFIIDNYGEMCGNLIYWCSDDDFKKLINSIDFKFTTINNLLTAIRADLVDSGIYGKIRTQRDVFLIDIKNTTNNKVVGYWGESLR